MADQQPTVTPSQLEVVLKALFSKDTLSWISVIGALLWSYAVKQATGDNAIRQQQEDHIAIQSMQQQLSAMSARVDLLVGLKGLQQSNGK